MSMHSVPCWSLSDKAPVALVPGYPAVHVPLQPHAHLPLTILPHDDGVPTPLFPNLTVAREIQGHFSRSCLETGVHRKCLTNIRIFTSPGTASPSKKMLTFGRSTAHFRENRAQFSPINPLDSQLKTSRYLARITSKFSICPGAHFRENPVLTFGRKGAHLREKPCSLSGELPLTFGRT